MIRVKIGFIKKQVDGEVLRYRPDLHTFCYERKHPFDFLRELLNIYFEKPTNNMKFGGLDISKATLAFLEPLRTEFETLYAEPQRTKSMGGSPTGQQPPAPYAANTPVFDPASQIPPHVQPQPGLNVDHNAPNQMERVPAAPYQAVVQPPPPVWNQESGIWETQQPFAAAPPPPPTPVWNGIEYVIPPPVAVMPPPPPPVVEQDMTYMPEVIETLDDIEVDKQLPLEEVKVETVQMKDVVFDPAYFIPLQTGTQLDTYMSLTEGLMPATNIMLQGPAGSGKSSVLIDIACLVKKNSPEKKVLFISGEMTKIDMKGLVDRFDGFNELDILFLNEYTDVDNRDLLDNILSIGWDMVIVDSFNEVLSSVIDTAPGSNINTRTGETWLINQFLKHNECGNDANLPTMFFFILQVGKDGKFVGSNRIKHAATAFLHLEFTKNQNLFLYFSKNRRGETYNNLFFEHHSKGIHYDFDKYNQDIAIREALKRSEIENKKSWASVLDDNKDGNNTTITVKAGEADLVEDTETNDLHEAVANFTPESEKREEERVADIEAGITPIPDRRTAHLTQQINLEDSIKEVEAETNAIPDILEIEEKEDEAPWEAGSTAFSEEEVVEAVKETMTVADEEAETIREDVASMEAAAEAMVKEEVITEQLSEIPETIAVSNLSGINLDSDEEVEVKDDEVTEPEAIEEEKEEKIVEKSIPKDNPNATDFSNLVEL